MKLDCIDIDPTEDVLRWGILQTDAGFLKIDNETGILSGKPVESDVGSYEVEIYISDEYGGLSSNTFKITPKLYLYNNACSKWYLADS